MPICKKQLVIKRQGWLSVSGLKFAPQLIRLSLSGSKIPTPQNAITAKMSRFRSTIRGVTKYPSRGTKSPMKSLKFSFAVGGVCCRTSSSSGTRAKLVYCWSSSSTVKFGSSSLIASSNRPTLFLFLPKSTIAFPRLLLSILTKFSTILNLISPLSENKPPLVRAVNPILLGSNISQFRDFAADNASAIYCCGVKPDKANSSLYFGVNPIAIVEVVNCFVNIDC
ncbi:hypothetical protein D3C86_1201320 [compost metagenome]